jgi:hypothetical protein
MFDKLCPDVSLYNVAFAHVPHSQHETGHAVPVTDDRVPREEQRLGALLGSRQLREHHPHHERLDHDAANALQTHHEDRLGTLLGGGATAVADRVLRLHAKKEARGEAVDVGDARGPRLGPVLQTNRQLQPNKAPPLTRCSSRRSPWV